MAVQREVPRWRKKPAPAAPSIQMTGRQAKKFARTFSTAMAAQQGPQPVTGKVVQAVQPAPVPGASLAYQSGAYRHRKQLVPFAWVFLLVTTGLGMHGAHALRPALVTALCSAAGIVLLSRHLSRFARNAASAVAGLTALWLPLLAAFGGAKPLPALLTLCWLAVTIPWCLHYQWRQPEAEEKVSIPHLSDAEIWATRVATKRLQGTYLTELEEIPGGRRWTVMLPHGDIVPGEVISNEARIAGGRDKPRTEVFVEPYPDGRESRAVLTILKRDNLRDVTEWDGSGLDADGLATIGRYADGAPARIRLYARRDGTKHGLIAGSSGAGKSYLLDSADPDRPH